ncbi:TylF/MycF/NovP-related O-methyltransferase [Streptomyces sp. SCL15-4]|uniref:TylF/MycF/NovP-related O-methyltransferase n=1 Tax=Streptomyces sp. SCL15-4 TaxID=2967221 RepID=UPI002966917A|nr:TylF/MycF/NovP-related O-methyltransferase [Streptomyces sp. SCL15-4]
MDRVSQSSPAEFSGVSVEHVRPTIATDDTYTELKRKFIGNGSTSAIGIAQRRDMVRRFEEIDRSVPIGTTPMDGLLLAELLMSTSADGDVVECGCFSGGSSAKLSIVAAALAKRLVIFDSFKGLLVLDEYDRRDYHARRHVDWMPVWYSGKYSASVETVKDNITRYGEISVCDFVPGYFEDTLQDSALPERIALAFTDVDTPTAVRTCLTRLWPRLAPGGVYASHDVALIKSLQALLSETVWRDEIGEFPPILFGAGFGVCNSAPNMGYFVKGEALTAEYLKSLTISKAQID